MRLELAEGVVTVAQLGPGFILAESPRDYPAGQGVLRLWVDGKERVWLTNVPAGVKAGWAKTEIGPLRKGPRHQRSRKEPLDQAASPASLVGDAS